MPQRERENHHLEKLPRVDTGAKEEIGGSEIMKKAYSGNEDFYAKKLERVMERMGIDRYNFDWTRKSCFVEMTYGGRTYRFENSVEKSAEAGRGLTCVSDLLAQVVLSLEGLARAVENGIFTLDMLMAGVPALPPAPEMPECFRAMEFTAMPETEDEVKAQYRRMAKVMHPDTGGNRIAFEALEKNLSECLREMRK